MFDLYNGLFYCVLRWFNLYFTWELIIIKYTPYCDAKENKRGVPGAPFQRQKVVAGIERNSAHTTEKA
jgi:hypothetical protein